jgi:predicted permease
LGSLLGVGFAWSLLRIFKKLAPVGIPRIHQAAVDGRMLILLIVSSFILAAIFALFTASHNPKPEFLTTGGRAAGYSRNVFRSLLTTAQVAISLTLLAVSGLLIKSLLNLQNVAPGIAVDHVTTAEVAIGPPHYSNAVSRQQLFETLSNRLRNLPGVKAVALSDTVPPTGFVHTRPARTLRVFGQPVSGPKSAGIVAWRSVSPDYFRTLNIPILQGRSFNAQDATGKDNPIIINQTWAHHLFGDGNPVGKAIGLNANSLLSIVGVAADVKNNGLSQPVEPEYYIIRKRVTDLNEGRDEVLASRALHWYDGDAFVIVRSSAHPTAVAGWIRSATGALDATVPVSISTMQDRVATLSERPRFTTLLLSFFALTGVILAAAGLYGLISFLVTQRTQEVGVRMAVGATPARIARLMLKPALFCTFSGVAIGWLMTVLVVRSLRGLVFQVPVENPALFSLAAGLMIAVALAATVIPTLRAARIDPVASLRRE